jgi:hypothetical protein
MAWSRQQGRAELKRTGRHFSLLELSEIALSLCQDFESAAYPSTVLNLRIAGAQLQACFLPSSPAEVPSHVTRAVALVSYLVLLAQSGLVRYTTPVATASQ